MAQFLRLLDAGAVDEGAVDAAEIGDGHATAFAAHLGVATRQARVGVRDLALLGSTGSKAGFRDQPLLGLALHSLQDQMAHRGGTRFDVAFGHGGLLDSVEVGGFQGVRLGLGQAAEDRVGHDRGLGDPLGGAAIHRDV
ncbi:MAG: hypothetical protein MUO38_15290 [Anaerolineales bacterium]|nr:hypothetical protein [Anaerolineales bacterium]